MSIPLLHVDAISFERQYSVVIELLSRRKLEYNVRHRGEIPSYRKRSSFNLMSRETGNRSRV